MIVEGTNQQAVIKHLHQTVKDNRTYKDDVPAAPIRNIPFLEAEESEQQS